MLYLRRYHYRHSVVGLWIIASLNTAPCFAQAPAAPTKVRAGAYYFDGWTGKTGHLTHRLRDEFFDREPVWGWRDDSLSVVEQQIDCAADQGLAFFAFDWYWPEGPDKEAPMNTGLKLYLQAKNKQRLQFCLLVANHGGFRIGPADWETVTDIWLPLFKEPTHVKVGGKPLLIFFAPSELRNSFGSSTAGEGRLRKTRCQGPRHRAGRGLRRGVCQARTGKRLGRSG